MLMDDNGFGGEKQSFLWRRWYSWHDKHILTIFFNPLSGSVLRKQPTTCRTNMKKLPPSVVKHGWEILHWRNSLFDEFPRYGYGSIPISTIFSGMNIHLPAILRFTRYQGFDPSPYLSTTWGYEWYWGFHYGDLSGVWMRPIMEALSTKHSLAVSFPEWDPCGMHFVDYPSGVRTLADS